MLEHELAQHQVRPGPAQVRRGAREEAGIQAQARTGADTRGDELHAAWCRHLGQVSEQLLLRSTIYIVISNYMNRGQFFFRPDTA